MKTANCNRSLLIWAIVLLVGSFAVVIPFNLRPAAWGALLALGAAAFYGALFFDQKVPRVLAKTVWVVAAVLRWLLLAYVMYAVVYTVNSNDVITESVEETCAGILFDTLVSVVALCVVMFPSQAMVAKRSKRDAARPAWTGVFHLIAAVLLYGLGTLMNKNVAVVTDDLLQGVGGIVVELILVLGLLTVTIAILAVAIHGSWQQKTVSDESSETVEETEE